MEQVKKKKCIVPIHFFNVSAIWLHTSHGCFSISFYNIYKTCPCYFTSQPHNCAKQKCTGNEQRYIVRNPLIAAGTRSCKSNINACSTETPIQTQQRMWAKWDEEPGLAEKKVIWKQKAEITESMWSCGWNQRATLEVEAEVTERMLLINILMNILGRIPDKPELDVQTIFISAEP